MSDMPGLSARRIVGLIPAAGRATRLGEMPWSKELLPVGFQPGAGEVHPQPKPVAQYLVEQMKRAGCGELFFIVRRGKWDIADYFGDGRRFGLDIGYLIVHEPWGPPFTLNQAVPFVGDATVVVGFPDILIHPPDALAQTVARLDATAADVVVGIFPAPPEDACDLVQSDASGRVLRLVPKEDDPDLGDPRSTWILAAWGPRFTAFLRARVLELAQIARARGRDEAKPPEWPVGSVIASAIETGLSVNSLHFAHGAFLDIGAPHRLVDAIRFPGVWDGQGQPPVWSRCGGA
ncbi:MAG: NTP transferase domain-containing protein [Burkholderiales bacterium]